MRLRLFDCIAQASASIPVIPSYPSNTVEPGSHSVSWPPDLLSSEVTLVLMGCVSSTLAALALDLCICTDLLVCRSVSHFFCNTLEALITRNCFFSTIANSRIPLADLYFFPFSLLVWLLLWLSFYLNRSTDPCEFPVAQFASFLCLLTPDFVVTSPTTEQLFKTGH